MELTGGASSLTRPGADWVFALQSLMFTTCPSSGVSAAAAEVRARSRPRGIATYTRTARGISSTCEAPSTISRAAADDAERAWLSAKVAELSAPDAQQQQAPLVAATGAAGGAPKSDREAFAERVEKALVERRLNPERVSVTGKDQTTIEVEGFACSPDFLGNVQKSPFGAEARSLGFKRITCAFEKKTAALDL
jgi:hypothetical protein